MQASGSLAGLIASAVVLLADAAGISRVSLPSDNAVVAAGYDAYASVPPGPNRNVATQWLAELLVHADRCKEAEATLMQDGTVLEGRIRSVVDEAIQQNDLPCAARLTRLQLARPDPQISPASIRTRLRLEAGAVLKAAGEADGSTLISDAELELRKEPASTRAGRRAREDLWRGRFTSNWINEGTAHFMPTLEAHARELAIDPTAAAPSTVNGFLVMLVGTGRMDLAEAIPKSLPGTRHQYMPLSQVMSITSGRGTYEPNPPHCPDFVRVDGPSTTLAKIAARTDALDRLRELKNFAWRSAVRRTLERCSAGKSTIKK